MDDKPVEADKENQEMFETLVPKDGENPPPVLYPCQFPGCPNMVTGRLCCLHRNYMPRGSWKHR